MKQPDIKPYIIGITGQTGSGKTFVIKSLKKIYGKNILVISQDQYYKDKSQYGVAKFEEINYDIPGAFENKELIADIKNLIAGRAVTLSEYDFVTHTRKEGKISFKPVPIIIVEGILIFHDPKLRQLFDLKIFLESDADIRLCRRLIRDIKERGYRIENLKKTIDIYLTKIKPMQKKYVQPLKKYADLVIDTNKGGKEAVKILRGRLAQLVRALR